MKLQIVRLYQTPIDDPKQTESDWYVINDNHRVIYECVGLELPWRENKRRVSCIPDGTYKAIKHNSPTFGKSFWIKDVHERSEILIHVGNYNKDTLGCLLPGQERIDINKDGLMDVTNSRNTMNDLYDILPNEFEVEILWRP